MALQCSMTNSMAVSPLLLNGVGHSLQSATPHGVCSPAPGLICMAFTLTNYQLTELDDGPLSL